MSKFRSKLENAKEKIENAIDDDPIISDKSETTVVVRHPKDNNDDDIVGDDWLSHKLEFYDHGAVLAKDATTKEDDWYDVYDPRNPLNKRRRGDSGHHAGKSIKKN